jgi:tetratricopeptide (TPR) repeat protein
VPRIPLLPFAFIAFVATPLFAQVERHTHAAGQTHAGSLGEVAFENSGAAIAQEPFLRGLALLHSFEYEDAAQAFREAQRADPSFAMAFYGEALTHAHLLWGEDDPDASRRALARLAPTPQARLRRTGSARERAYGAAVEAFFAEADLPTRVLAFADSMRRVAAAFPDDIDALGFTALSLMFAEYVGMLPAEQRRPLRDEAITLAERAYRAHPNHPGALHYLIHATDDPDFAARGEAAARSYAAIAPDAEHALHMPSHIFLQLGQWDDVVASNERAWAASRADVAARGGSGVDLSFHALQWLQYGYLQQGRHRDASALADTARAVLAGIDLDSGAHPDARFAVASLEFVYALNTGDWSPKVCAAVRYPAFSQAPRSDRERSFRTIGRIQSAIAELACEGREGEAGRALRAEAAVDGQADARFREMTPMLDAIAKIHGGEPAAAVVLLEPRANSPGRPPVGPPSLPRWQELLGEALLHRGSAAEAVAVWETALRFTPNRAAVLAGLARARAAAGDREGAAAAYRQLLGNWHRADSDIALLAEARAGAGG